MKQYVNPPANPDFYDFNPDATLIRRIGMPANYRHKQAVAEKSETKIRKK
jgi:hypothetical protein